MPLPVATFMAMAMKAKLLHEHPLPPHVSLLPLTFQVNRQRISVSPLDTTIAWDSTLLEFLRDKLRLTGTKLGCGEGGCGACCVVLLRPKSSVQQLREGQHGIGNGLPYDIRAVNSCLMPLVAVHGCQIITVEGIGTEKHPHAIQQRLVSYRRVQLALLPDSRNKTLST